MMFYLDNYIYNMVEEMNDIDKLSKTSYAEKDGVECYLLKPDIFYVYLTENTKGSLASMQFVFEHYDTLAKDKPLKVIAEYGPYASLEVDAREYVQAHKTIALCEALVMNSLAQRIIVNFMITFKSHDHPSKAFKSLEDAIKWTDQFTA